MIKIDELLKVTVEMNASDLHLKAMRPPLIRKDGVLRALKYDVLKPEIIEQTLLGMLKDRHKKELEEKQSVDIGYSVPGLSRFRVNIFLQRGTHGAVFRRIPIQIPALEDWGLPPVLADFAQLNNGLLLVTGPTGSGKSSTLAAIIREINEKRQCHIITVEDPIEFLFRDVKSAISQREVGMDTPNFQQALRNALRQDPDVIMVGEMRDLETIETAITASETGHLVLSTLHTNSAAQSIDRILDTFPANQAKQVRIQLSQVMRAIVCMKLLPRKDGNGLVAAVEICRNSPVISKMIEENRITEIEEEIGKSVAYYQMQTLNQSLTALVVHNQISLDVALRASPQKEELDLQLRKIFFSENQRQQEGGDMADCYSDYSKIEELMESKRLYTELQDKFSFEVESREGRIHELEGELQAMDEKLQQAFKQLDRILKEKEQLTAEKEKVREQYEKKFYQMRKQMEERLRQSRGG